MSFTIVMQLQKHILSIIFSSFFIFLYNNEKQRVDHIYCICKYTLNVFVKPQPKIDCVLNTLVL